MIIDSDVTIVGPGAGLLSISGDDVTQVFEVSSGVTATIRGLTVTEGHSEFSAGGIRYLGDLTVQESVIEGNTGGLAGNGNLVLEDSIVRDNVKASSSLGGGVHHGSGGSVTIRRSELVNNQASQGGALFIWYASLVIEDSLVAYNTGTSSNGGIHVFESSATITNSTISHNIGGTNGYNGFVVPASIVPISVTLTNVTIANNHSTSTLGYSGLSNLDSQLLVGLHNSIVAGNTNANGASDLLGNFDSSSSHNLIGYDTNLTNGINHDPSGTGNLVGGESGAPTIDPLLAPLGNYGGKTRTHALLVGSPAIDAGSASSTLSYDQRGEGYDRLVGDFVDIGAFESGNSIAPLVVNTLDDELDALGPGDYMEDLSLREAIALAALLPGDDTIVFDEDLWDSTLTLSMGQLVIDSDVTILGPGADRLSISGNDASRVFYVTSGVEATIQGLTIAGGYVTNGNRGGGIQNSGTLTLDSVAVVDNVEYSTGTDGSGGGGGMYHNGSSLTILNSTFSGNVAARHGGGLRAHTGNVSIVNSTFSDNTAQGGSRGAGLYLGHVVEVEMINSTVTNNTAGYRGGGYGLQGSGTLEVHNTIISGNTAGSSAYDDGDLALVAASSYNLLGSINNGISPPTGGWNIYSTDPRLAPLDYYGGPTKTHALLPDSPAINAGNNDYAVDPESESLPFDQRGQGYPRILNGTVDIGATEAYLKGVYDGILEIYGTENPDTILVSSTGISHSAFGDIEADLSELDEVRIYGFGGDDYLAVDAAFAAIAKLYGGDGSDDLYGGAAADFLFGELGDDELYGRDGDDTLDGGAGNDFLQGDAGNDAYTGGDGHDFFQPDAGDDLNTPKFESIDNVSVRRSQSYAFRLLADDLEDEYDELSFEVVNVTGSDTLQSGVDYSIADGIFRWFAAANRSIGSYGFDLRVRDTSNRTDTTSFSVSLSGYNEAPPSFELDGTGGYFYISGADPSMRFEWGALDGELISGADDYNDFEPGVTDSQTTNPNNFSFGGALSGGTLSIDWESMIGTSDRREVSVTDDGADGGTPRTRKSVVYVAAWDHQFDSGITEIYPGIALDIHAATSVDTPIPVSLRDSDMGLIDIGVDDPIFTMPSPEHGTISNWDSAAGTFTYTPDPGFEGIDSWTFSFQHTGVIVNAWNDYDYIGSNEATVVIEVGKAVRADISTGVPEEREHIYPGQYVEINSDDDNSNSIPDRNELKTVANENDLVPVGLSYWLRDDAYEDDFIARLYSPTEGTIRVWTSPTKDKQIVPASPNKVGTEWKLADMPATVYVEAIAGGNKELTLQIEGPSTALFDDMITPADGAAAPTSDADTVVFAAGAKLLIVDFTHTHTITSDNTAEAYDGYWQDWNEDGDAEDREAGDVLTPAAYTRTRPGQNEYLSTTTTFRIDPVAVTGDVYIRGTGPDSIVIPATQATVVGDWATISDVQATTPFVNTIKYYDGFTIDWEISLDGGASYIKGGQSDNPLYLTWEDPALPTLTLTVLHTAVVAADGVGGTVGVNDDLVLDKIWDKIATLHIETVDKPKVLSYYGFRDNDGNGTLSQGDTLYNDTLFPYPDLADDYIELVANGNGICDAWASFMIASLWSQGLTHVNSEEVLTTEITPKDPAIYFAVKNWNKNGAGPTWIMISSIFTATLSETFEFPLPGEAADAQGIPGQGNSPNPPSVFERHVIVSIDGVYYDPSYGVGLYTDRKKYEIDAFEGPVTWDDVNQEHLLHESPADDGNANNHADEINDYTNESASNYIPGAQ